MSSSSLINRFLMVCLLSAYIFSFGFTFFPVANTKQIIGVVGVLAFMLKCLKERSVRLSGIVLTSALWAIVFSVWCYFSMVANNTDDMSYASYILSFAIWLGGAYGVISLMRVQHGRASLSLFSQYFAAICVAQCILAILIDRIEGFQIFVDTYIGQGQDFLHRVHRMYGIGASLDTAGIKFSAALIMIAHQIGTDKSVTGKKWRLALNLICYAIITICGNMISRTTTVGAVMGLAYMGLMIGVVRRGMVTVRQIRFYVMLVVVTAAFVVTAILLYRSNPEFRHDLRFGFESFFNYFESGSFRSSSTDKLNSTMWMWPTDTRSWIIGTGIFGNFVYSTDIGYCRFVLYCGLIGMAIFSGYFIYNGLAVSRKFKNYALMSVMMISLSFVIWLKVATDLFLFNAILFCLDGDYDEDGNEIETDTMLETQ